MYQDLGGQIALARSNGDDYRVVELFVALLKRSDDDVMR